MKISPDTLDKILSIMGVGPYQTWPVMKGNSLTLLDIRTSTCLRAKIGDRVPVTGGGFVEKVATDGWVQWRWYGPDSEPPPLIGKVLLWNAGAREGQRPEVRLERLDATPPPGDADRP